MGSQESGHDIHRAANVGKDLIALAEVMLSQLAVRERAKRSFGHPPLHAKRTSQSRQYWVSVSSLSRPNFRCCGDLTSSRFACL